MITKPLLEKPMVCSPSYKYMKDFGAIQFLPIKFVVEALKKFKSAEIVRRGDWNVHCSRCDNDDGIYYLVYNKELDEIELVCPDCWFKECFGELPKESKLYGVSMSKLSIMEATIYDRNIVVLENNNLLPFLEDCYNEFKIKYTEITGREYSDNK